MIQVKYLLGFSNKPVLQSIQQLLQALYSTLAALCHVKYFPQINAKLITVISGVNSVLKKSNDRHFFLSILSIFICLCLSFELAACSLVMGYRTSERQPLIARAPDNNGLYKELYTKAAHKIGCSLEVKRLPKKRILRLLQ